MKNNSSRKSVTQTDFHLFSQAASLIFKFFSIGRFLCIERLVTLNVQLSSWGKRSDERSLSLVYQFTSQDSPLTTHLSLRVIFDRKLYREVVWSYEINPALDEITFFSFLHRPKKKQKRLGLFLCLRKLQKRFLHAKQTVSLVLCSFILSSPLFCFPNSIKSRPFSKYLFVVFIKIWIVNFEILNMKYSSPRGCHFEWFSIENCIEKCNKVNEDAEMIPRLRGSMTKLTTHD